ncbi:MAG: type II toxin-antitoxin system RelE/ParE family toxin [Deltaproteobacteria bacterium]
MSREVHFEAEAQVELEEAMLWYERRGDGLGDALLDAVDAALLKVVEMPFSFPDVAGAPEVQRALVAGFPYGLVFVTSDDRITVLAVSHAKRRPLYWRRRLARQ